MSKKKLTESQERQVQYMVKVLNAIQEGCFEEESDNAIDLKDFNDSEKLTEFLHVVATAVPSQIYEKLTGNQVDHLQFNHIANQLCFQFLTKEE